MPHREMCARPKPATTYTRTNDESPLERRDKSRPNGNSRPNSLTIRRYGRITPPIENRVHSVIARAKHAIRSRGSDEEDANASEAKHDANPSSQRPPIAGKAPTRRRQPHRKMPRPRLAPLRETRRCVQKRNCLRYTAPPETPGCLSRQHARDRGDAHRGSARRARRDHTCASDSNSPPLRHRRHAHDERSNQPRNGRSRSA